MREVTAGHQHCWSLQQPRRLGYHLPQMVVMAAGQAGEANADNLPLEARFLQEVQRNQSGMVKGRRFLPHDACREVLLIRQSAKLLAESYIILGCDLHLRGTEIAKIPFGPLSRRDMEVIAIHDAMRAGDNHRLRGFFHHPLRCFAIGINSRLNPLLLPPAYFRNDKRGMGHGNRT